jgi:hypothetical protein
MEKVMLVSLEVSEIIIFQALDSRIALAHSNLEGCSKDRVKKSLQHLGTETPPGNPQGEKCFAHSL